jgi:cysteinyl-tRNA synthetase
MTGFMIDVLGLKQTGTEDASSAGDSDLVDGLMHNIIDLRKRARQNKDFDTADRIRDGLTALGVTLKDTPEGTNWMKD